MTILQAVPTTDLVTVHLTIPPTVKLPNGFEALGRSIAYRSRYDGAKVICDRGISIVSGSFGKANRQHVEIGYPANVEPVIFEIRGVPREAVPPEGFVLYGAQRLPVAIAKPQWAEREANHLIRELETAGPQTRLAFFRRLADAYPAQITVREELVR